MVSLIMQYVSGSKYMKNTESSSGRERADTLLVSKTSSSALGYGAIDYISKINKSLPDSSL